MFITWSLYLFTPPSATPIPLSFFYSLKSTILSLLVTMSSEKKPPDNNKKKQPQNKNTNYQTCAISYLLLSFSFSLQMTHCFHHDPFFKITNNFTVFVFSKNQSCLDSHMWNYLMSQCVIWFDLNNILKQKKSDPSHHFHHLLLQLFSFLVISQPHSFWCHCFNNRLVVNTSLCALSEPGAQTYTQTRVHGQPLHWWDVQIPKARLRCCFAYISLSATQERKQESAQQVSILSILNSVADNAISFYVCEAEVR